MKTLKQLQEIIGRDIKSDIKTLDNKAFFQKHGKRKSEVSSFVEAKDEGEYGYEGDMAINQLNTIIRHSNYLIDMLKPDTDLPEWVQSKITLAADYIQTSCDYLTSEMDEAVEDDSTMDEMAGANMDVRQVHKHLKKSGWSLTRTSGGHDVYTHPKSTEHIAVPRHRSLKAPLVLGIMKTAKKVSEEVEQLEEGRPSQQHPLEGHEYHKKSDAELKYIAKDAHEAAEAMKSHGTESGRRAENKYRDQASDSATVRYFRKKSGMPDWYKKKYGHVKEDVELDEGMSGGSYASFHKETGKIGYIGNKTGMIKHVKSNPDHARGYTGPDRKVGDIFGGYPKKTVKEEVELDEGAWSKEMDKIEGKKGRWKDEVDKMEADKPKKKPQGADFAAERRKERLAKNGRMDEASKTRNSTRDFLRRNPVKPEEMAKPVSRKAQIVKSAAKKDKFIADPMISNTNVKADGDQR